VNIQVSCRSWRVYNTVTVRICLEHSTYPNNLYARGLKYHVLNTNEQCPETNVVRGRVLINTDVRVRETLQKDMA
jgi:hypothetical protein